MNRDKRKRWMKGDIVLKVEKGERGVIAIFDAKNKYLLEEVEGYIIMFPFTSFVANDGCIIVQFNVPDYITGDESEEEPLTYILRVLYKNGYRDDLTISLRRYREPAIEELLNFPF